jgi:hypothetical protein
MKTRFVVYHRREPTFRTDDVHVFLRRDYEKVAEVECEEIGDVFRITNHIDEDWTTNPEVIWSLKDVRSTSVGDVVRIDTGYGYGTPMIYDPFGLRPIPDYQQAVDHIFRALSTFPQFNKLSLDAQGDATVFITKSALGISVRKEAV